MSKNRIKTQSPTITTREEAEAAMNLLAEAEAAKRRLSAELDSQILGLKDQYAPLLSAREAEIKLQFTALRAWAEAHPQEFGKKKSLQLLAGVLGFRTGTPKLALLSKAWNWDKVLAAALVYLPNFIRQKPELDKEQILAQRDELEPVFHRVGVKVVQDESFYVEPNLTEPEKAGA